MRKVRHSFSAGNQFSFCERQFFYDRVQRLPQEPSHYLSVGNLYHDLLAEMLETNDSVSAERIITVLGEHKAKPDWVCPTADDRLVKEVDDNLKRVHLDILPHVEPRVSETGELEVERWHRGTFLGKIDCVSVYTPTVDDRLQVIGHEAHDCIIDWKSKSSLRNRRLEFTTDMLKQGSLYCLMKDVDRVCFVEIPRDTEAPVHTLVHQFSADELARWGRFHAAIFDAMDTRGPNEAAYKLADPGSPLCCARWCSHWRRCPGGEGKDK